MHVVFGRVKAHMSECVLQVVLCVWICVVVCLHMGECAHMHVRAGVCVFLCVCVHVMFWRADCRY